MTSPLAMNHQGHLFCPLAMNSFGHIVCDGVTPEPPDEKDILSGSGGSKFQGWLMTPSADLTADDIRAEIHSETDLAHSETEDATVDYVVPKHRNKAQPIAGGKALEDFDSWLDRELAKELRIEEMRLHALMERVYAEEIKQLEEELAVVILAATL